MSNAIVFVVVLTALVAVFLIFFGLVQWVITDARHDSTSNAYHTTVPCLSGTYVDRSVIFDGFMHANIIFHN